MLNYTSSLVTTLAHELGHGLHAALAWTAARSSSTRRSRWPRPRRCSAR